MYVRNQVVSNIKKGSFEIYHIIEWSGLFYTQVRLTPYTPWFFFVNQLQLQQRQHQWWLTTAPKKGSG